MEMRKFGEMDVFDLDELGRSSRLQSELYFISQNAGHCHKLVKLVFSYGEEPKINSTGLTVYIFKKWVSRPTH